MDFDKAKSRAIECVNYLKRRCAGPRVDARLIDDFPDMQPHLAGQFIRMIDEAWLLLQLCHVDIGEGVVARIEQAMAAASMSEIIRWNGHAAATAHQTALVIISDVIACGHDFYLPGVFGAERNKHTNTVANHRAAALALAAFPIDSLEEIEARIRIECAQATKSIEHSARPTKSRKQRAEVSFSDSDVQLVMLAVKRVGKQEPPDAIHSRGGISMAKNKFLAVLRNLELRKEYSGFSRKKREA
jgi:hypothetical protein